MQPNLIRPTPEPWPPMIAPISLSTSGVVSLGERYFSITFLMLRRRHRLLLRMGMIQCAVSPRGRACPRIFRCSKCHAIVTIILSNDNHSAPQLQCITPCNVWHVNTQNIPIIYGCTLYIAVPYLLPPCWSILLGRIYAFHILLFITSVDELPNIYDAHKVYHSICSKVGFLWSCSFSPSTLARLPWSTKEGINPQPYEIFCLI